MFFAPQRAKFAAWNHSFNFMSSASVAAGIYRVGVLQSSFFALSDQRISANSIADGHHVSENVL